MNSFIKGKTSSQSPNIKDIANFDIFIWPDLCEDDTKNAIKKVFSTKNVLINNHDMEISSIPFNHCVIKNFLCYKDKLPANDFVELLGSELLKMEFHPKSNDLYKFQQTNELMVKSIDENFNKSSPCLRKFSKLLRNVLLPWLRDVIDPELNDDIDMFSAQYSSTDHLLCHDDLLEGRHLAYVYYLTPNWSKEDGGTLDLFEADTSQHHPDPASIVKSINPSFNSLVLFQVSPTSFHQVAEVLSTSKTRLSLTGWFHGPTSPISPRSITEPSPISGFVPVKEELVLQEWVNPTYTNLMTQSSVQEQFVEDSEVQLPDFFISEQHQALQESLRTLDACDGLWRLCGPPNKCRYFELKLDSPARIKLFDRQVAGAVSKIRSLLELFHSEEMFLFLSNITGLSLHPMAINSDSEDEEAASKRRKVDGPAPKPGCRSQVRKWGKGSYTLVRDTDHEQGEYALDVNLFFCPTEWSEGRGGCTSYIVSGGTEELLSILPRDNALTLTYRDKSSIRFVQYLNHTAVDHFHDLSLVYYE